MKLRLALCFLATGGIWTGCTGAVDGVDRANDATPGAGGRGGTTVVGGGGSGGNVTPAPNAKAAVGPMPLRRLSRIEYRNTLRDLQITDKAEEISRDIPEDTRAPFGFGVAGDVSNLEVDRFMNAAEAVGRGLTDPARLKAVVGCEPATGDEACVRAFISSFGRRAYRRPLANDEVTELLTYFRSARTTLNYGFADGVRLLVQVMLQSPSFLYRWELGNQQPAREGALVRLGSHEVASRLSYFLWGTMPDAPLFTAADKGELATSEQIGKQAERMVADPKALATIKRFHHEWLELEALETLQKDPKLVANFTTLAPLFAKESDAFVEHVFTAGGGKLETLLAAPFSFLDETLAKHYGVTGVTGATLHRVDLDPTQRLGLLTQASFLAVHAPPNSTSPVRRGKVVLERLLCDPPPPPPEGLEIMPPIPDPKLQAREQFVQHSTVPSCRACHVRMDNIGFALEGYDTAGKFRTEEAGRPLDTRVTIPALDGADRSVAGGVELVKLLAQSPQVRLCVAKQWTRFAMGRLETAEEEAGLKASVDELARTGFDLRRLLVTITKSQGFGYRTPFAWEVQ